MSTDPAIRDHKAWLGYLQPEGLVVSPAALVDSQVILDRNTLPLQTRFLAHVRRSVTGDDDSASAIPDFATFARTFLEWPEDCLFGLDGRPLPESLHVGLADFGEVLAPTLAFQDPNPKDPAQPWLLLVKELPTGTDLDTVTTGAHAGWSASASQRFERLLRETKVPIGLLTNGKHIRLVYAPKGENTGNLTFRVQDMSEVAGRTILAAFDLLLNRYRLLAAPSDARLPVLLARSRDYQSRVSTALAQQVLAALYELLRGFQAADERTNGELLRGVLQQNPDDAYAGMLNVLMRLVFLLYAEDRGLMPGGDLYVRNYSAHGLFERLRDDNEQYPDTMDQRYGAWPRLVALFRAVYDGCRHPQLKMPPRRGYLFDPDRFPFLEGRFGPGTSIDIDVLQEPQRLPLVPDGVIYRVLNNLLVLDGERLSYRTLDVEQIGSVYEAMMGFRLELASGPSIAIRAAKAHGAPATINIEELLAVKAADRAKWLTEQTDQKLTGEALESLKKAQSLDDLLVALEKKIARHATPSVAAKGAMILQPSDERRRSGSHYTPRSLTEPIVRKTLRPILERLGAKPTPEQILDLKVCDSAMGSGAFLVEACRQLADELVNAWHAHGKVPKIDPDETEDLYARRIIAQRCLYGVDKNPMAVDLAKLSLWLATLAKDHPFTFLDHSLRCGDSLVGLTREQIVCFHWEPAKQRRLYETFIRERVERATAARREILDAGDTIMPELKRQKLDKVEEALDLVRFVGDLAVAAFFEADNDKKRKARRDELLAGLTAYLEPGNMDMNRRKPLTEAVDRLHGGNRPIVPFHWEIEFPEVFGRETGGFDAIIGNPPFMGGMRISASIGEAYRDWLYGSFADAGNRTDLIAYFFRQAFSKLRTNAALGLIATKTIAQGDTRIGGLRAICKEGGVIYGAVRRLKWPGDAAVIVSVAHIAKGTMPLVLDLDGSPVNRISAYLFASGGDDNPFPLLANDRRSHIGCNVLGMGFTFDDTDATGVATPLNVMERLVERNARNREVIFPFIGGQELNEHPRHAHHRYVINFGSRSQEEAATWPELYSIILSKVKPYRDQVKRDAYRARWWQFAERQTSLQYALAQVSRTLAIAQTSNALAFVFMPANIVFAHTVVVIPFESYAAFAALQSRAHQLWASTFAATMKDDLRYIPTDCFATFPFPSGFVIDPRLEAPGKQYYESRAALMVRNGEGLTKTYNRFHNPDETSPDILKLRELHATMDRAVLYAYGWTDIPTDCQFLLDYEEEEDEDDDSVTATRGRGRKKPWRYRWPDEIRDLVLARLLDLNAKRAEEERLAGNAAAASQGKEKKATPGRKKKTATEEAQMELGDPQQAE